MVIGRLGLSGLPVQRRVMKVPRSAHVVVQILRQQMAASPAKRGFPWKLKHVFCYYVQVRTESDETTKCRFKLSSTQNISFQDIHFSYINHLRIQ